MAITKNSNRRKITFKDIEELLQNFEKYYERRSGDDKSPLLMLKTICEIYWEHMDKQPNKKINLNKEANRPTILRSEVIRRYTGKEPNDYLIEEYKTVKGVINRKLKAFARKKDRKLDKVLNPKGLRLVFNKKNEGEKSNYFSFIEPSPKPRQKPLLHTEHHLPMSSSTPIQIFNRNFDKWKFNNFLGEKALKPADLIKIETEINPLELDDEKLAYFYISCVFRRHNYHTWWKTIKDRKRIIWHLLNLLVQSYHRPFWRAAFILQYVESSLFSEIISEFPEHILKNERIRMAINTITDKNVEIYIIENKDQELYAEELSKEFSVYKYSFDENDG